jgi:hypothetical protein
VARPRTRRAPAKAAGCHRNDGQQLHAMPGLACRPGDDGGRHLIASYGLAGGLLLPGCPVPGVGSGPVTWAALGGTGRHFGPWPESRENDVMTITYVVGDATGPGGPGPGVMQPPRCADPAPADGAPPGSPERTAPVPARASRVRPRKLHRARATSRRLQDGT